MVLLFFEKYLLMLLFTPLAEQYVSIEGRHLVSGPDTVSYNKSEEFTRLGTETSFHILCSQELTSCPIAVGHTEEGGTALQASVGRPVCKMGS